MSPGIRALILAGGRGTNLRPLSYARPKQLLPVANKPILFHVLDRVAEAGITEVGIVVSPDTNQQIRQTVGDGSQWQLSISYIKQLEALGLAHAVSTAQDFLGDSPFLLFLGDILLQNGIQPLVSKFRRLRAEALIVLQKVADPWRCGIVEMDGDGRVLRLEEKPKQPRSNLGIVGVYLFTPRIHQAISRIQPSRRGELEITDAIQELVTMGDRVVGHILEGWWIDTGNPANLLRANRLALDESLCENIQGSVDHLSSLKGRIEIRQGTVVEASRIRGPVSIGAGCRISHSTIGPYTALGEGTVVESSGIENSILLENCRIQRIERLVESLVGAGTTLIGRERSSAPARILVGDDARMEV